MILLPFTLALKSSPSYSPLELGDKLLAWWDANDASTFTLAGGSGSYDEVVDWTDKKSGFVLNAVPGARPAYDPHRMNNAGAVVFTGSQQLSTGTSSATFGTDVYNVFAAATVDSTSGEWCRILSYIATGDTFPWATAQSAILLCREPPPSKAIASYSNSVQRSSKELKALGIPAILEYWRDGADGTAATDAVDGTPTAVVGAMGATGQFNVGADGTLANPFAGMITSIIITKGTLTTEEREKVQGYLAWLARTERHLPLSHPWKSVSPIPVAPLPTPRTRLTFYYGGDPAAVEGLNDTTLAGQYFAANFDHVVLGQGLDDPLSPGHENAIAVVAAAKAANPNIRFYGYVHMSPRVDIPPNYTTGELDDICTRWATLVKTDGVFLDECEQGFETSIPRINHVLDTVHGITSFYGRQFCAIVNGWDHAYFVDGVYDATYNPMSEKAHILPIDFTCIESQTFNNTVSDYLGASEFSPGSDGFAHANFMLPHLEPCIRARRHFQCGFFAVNVYDVETTDAGTLSYAWANCQHVAKIYGNTATAMCVKDFGASGAGAGLCPAFTHDNDYDQYISCAPVVAGQDMGSVTNGSVIRYENFYYWSTLGVHIVVAGAAM